MPTLDPAARPLVLDDAAAPHPQRAELLAALLDAGHPVACRPAEPPEGALTLTTSDAKDTDHIAVADRSPEDVLATLTARREAASEPKPGRWKPWFPVIDHDRCTDCMQCLSFCLFGVYGVTDIGGIDVASPQSCKTDCPACSRVCPEVAILFPKYHHAPINGAPVSEQDVQREAMKVDISSLLGGDIYKALRERSAKAKSRFSRERDDERALKERKRCLNKLKDQLGIPDEVLAALPSQEEIQRKARELKERMAKHDKTTESPGEGADS